MTYHQAINRPLYGVIKMHFTKITTLALLIALGMASAAMAGEVDVVDVKVYKSTGGLYTFHASLLHEDTGWDHYANKWEIIDSSGKVLGTRILHHPHVDEQPFTRSLAGVAIPNGVNSVTIRAYDSVHADGGTTITVTLP